MSFSGKTVMKVEVLGNGLDFSLSDDTDVFVPFREIVSMSRYAVATGEHELAFRLRFDGINVTFRSDVDDIRSKVRSIAERI